VKLALKLKYLGPQGADPDIRAFALPEQAGGLKMLRILCFLGLLCATLLADVAQAAPYGPTGTLGPAGATVRTCDGLANCFICSTGSCVPSGSWQSLIEDATAGRTVLLRTGNYDPSGTLTVPSGTSSAPILVGSYDGERPVIRGPVRVDGSFVTLEGLKIQTSTDSYALRVDRASSSALRNACSGGCRTAPTSGRLLAFQVDEAQHITLLDPRAPRFAGTRTGIGTRVQRVVGAVPMMS
jgi:hypothetical protein